MGKHSTPQRLLLAVALACAALPPSASAQDRPEATSDDGRERQVMERFLDLLEKNPRRGTALDRVYGYHVERGTLDRLIQTFQDRATEDPKDGKAWMLLGLFEAQRGRDAAAVAALRKAEETRPDDPLPSYYLGQALVLVGQPEKAAEAFERAIARRPPKADLLEVFQALGRVHQRAHHNEEALKVWKRLEALFPDDPRVQEQIAAALAEESQPEEALPRYEALAKKTADPYRKVQFRMEAAELKVKLGKPDEALRTFESLLGQLNPETWLYREVRRKIEEVFLRNDDQSGLAAYYEGWLKKNPEDVEAMSRLGRTLAILGRAPDAQKWFDKAVKLAPSRKELRQALVEQLVQEKKYAEAAAQYEAMAKADPNNPDTLREWGRLLLKDVNRPEAERKNAAASVWRKLVEARPKDAATAVQVADLFRQAEMPDDAIALYKKSIELAPGSAQYYEYLGEYYHTLKRSDEALATWSQIAAGKNKHAKSLARLAEVLSGFGYNKEAIAPIAEACLFDPDNFDLRQKHADLLVRLERYDEALKQLDAALKAADDPEQIEAALALQIRVYQATDKLDARIAELKAELDAGKEATADRWRRLARLDEAAQRLPEATSAIGKAVALDEKSVPSWVAFARIHEATGDVGAAAAAYRKLAALDRRALSEYLMQVAKLEVRLGRRDRALKAGRDLLAAAPGNPEAYEFYADLCFQLGESDEGLDALRRAVRVNPADPKAVLTLAENLARQFRTEEAIELYWRAFDKANDLDGKLSVVARLAELYLQRNQFDRLVARLERQGREDKSPREMTICLAAAHQASGDYGSARQELERLLATNARDTVLLQQLSSLAETDSDLANAVKYQKQLNEIAPSDEGSARLAQLYLRAGESDEAEAIWARLAGGKQEPHRVLQTIDNLLHHGKPETVLGITERFLRDHPGHWEALYREGVALVALEKRDEAAKRFRALLDLRLPDDEPSEGAKAAKKAKTPAGRPAGRRISQFQAYQTFPLQDRVNNAWQIRYTSGLEGRNYWYGQQNQWSPADFGQARMAASARLLAIAQRDNTQDDWLKAAREGKDKTPKDPRKLWDWYYLTLVRQEAKETYEAARDLARQAGNDPNALYAYLSSLTGRAIASGPQVYRRPGEEEKDKTPPLPGGEIDEVLADYRALRARKPDQAGQVVSNVALELKRAKRTGDYDALYREAVESADDPLSLNAAMTLATERGDLDTLMKLVAKADKLQGHSPFGAGGLADHSGSLIQIMSARSDEKKHADVLKILDDYLDWAEQPEPAKRRQQALAANQPYYNNANFSIYLKKRYQYINIDYPKPSRYFDSAGLSMLREAFEIYKRDDLLSDMFAHFRDRAGSVPEARRVYPRLALGYLHWWNDDKDEALKELTAASEAAPNDTELRLALAEIRAKRSEPQEALELVDSVEPLDQKTMQRREIMALGLAVQIGDVERARKASERLFNLRLDTDTQVQLAAQMHQLGMHDLAEAVLARARRRAGNNANTLVGLMQQYQRQNKIDTAVQVAHQILRRAPARQFTPWQDENDVAQREAIQTLARSGKLKELIARVEAQLKTSPNSVQLLRALADYHKAAGDKDKVREVQGRIAALRPDDAQLRYQIAMQMIESGDAAAALPHLKAALKKEPSLFNYRYWEIQNAYQQAGKNDELANLFEELDVKALGNVWGVSQTVSNLMRDEKSRERGMALFRKMWKAFPDERQNLLANFYDDSIWRLPEMYDYAREAVLPLATQKMRSAWYGVDQINSWSGGGRGNGVATRLLEAATKQNKLDALQKEVEEKVKQMPDWSGGKGLLAIILAKRGKYDEAKALLQPLIDKAAEKDEEKREPIAYNARLTIGQELEDYGPLQQVTLALYQGMNEDEGPNINGGEYEWSPIRRLVEMYKKMGRKDESRAIVLKFLKRPDTTNWGDPNYAKVRHLEERLSIGDELLNLGFPADAVPLFNEVLADTDALSASKSWYGNQDYMANRARQGLNRGLRGLNKDTIGPTVKSLLKPGEAGSAVDLILLINPRELDTANVTSLFADVVGLAAKQPDLKRELDSAVAGLLDKAPKDFSVQVAAALVASAEGKPEALVEAAGRLAKLTDEQPLEDLSEGARANARQRAEAARRLGLWLVARECWKHDATRSLGDGLAATALEAARRQADTLWPLAMLREWGQVALDRGDRDGAERQWTRMLDLVLANAAARPNPPEGDPKRPKAGNNSPPTPLDRFEQAAGLAKLAAKHGMFGLSLKAVREPLRNGPPIIPIAIDAGQNRQGMIMTVRSGNNNDDQSNQIAQKVEERLEEIDRLWRARSAPAAEVYEVLRDAVMPEARPGELFLYPRPLANNVRQPLSVAKILAHWAAEAKRLDDLSKRIEARRSEPSSALPTLVLKGQVGLATNDDALVVESLKALDERLKTDKLQTSAQLACDVALPALERKATAAEALPVVEAATRALANSGQEPEGGLHLALAHAHFAAGRAEEGRKQVREYQSVLDRNMPNYGGDYGLYVRKQHLQQVAAEFARAGQWADTLDVLGQFVDAPAYSGGDPGLGNIMTKLAVQFSELPARERYDRLKSWMLPTANRKSIRLLASFVPEDAPPEVFGKFSMAGFDRGVASTAGMLIAAAKETDALNDLAAEVAKLAGEKVENAEALLALVQVARGKGEALRDRLKPKLEELATREKKDSEKNKPIPWSEVLVARACLSDPALRADLGEPMARALIGQAQRTQNWPFLSHLRQDLAASQVARAGVPASAIARDPGLAHWTPATTADASSHAGGAPPLWWNAAEGHVTHVTGPGDDLLFFDFPLTGRFEFSADAYTGGWAEGHVAYGGLVAEANANGVPSAVFPFGRGERVPLSSKFMLHEAFNRFTVQVEPEKVRYLVNGHLFYEDDDPSPTAPWVALFCTRERQSTFRNLRVTGDPQIPREVPLTHADRLDGWVSNFHWQSQPPRRSLEPGDPRREALASENGLDQYDWSARDGVIRGKRTPASSGQDAIQGRLYYARPLQDGESITYEFRYEPGEVMVHLTLDRVAFLIEPDGVRLHWITDGADNEWTGLETDNVADEPANRKGPAKLPLKEKEWNAAKLSLKGGVAILELNGVEIYRRPMEADNSRQFGFFHFKDRTEAKARDVVLRGDWPASLSAAQVADLLAPRADAGSSVAKRKARHDLIGEETLGKSVGQVLKAARALSSERRYAYLADWVLPRDDRPGFRLLGEFNPTDAAPPVASPAPEIRDNGSPRRVHTGGQLESPALELVAIAKELGKLDELADRVEKSQVEGERDQRGRLALLALVRAAQGSEDDAAKLLGELKDRVKALPPDSPRWTRWPEQVAHWGLMGRPKLREANGALMSAMLDLWHYANGHGIWFSSKQELGHELMYATHRANFLLMGEADRAAVDVDAKLKHWSRVEHPTAQVNGRGSPIPRWRLTPEGLLQHDQGQEHDFLYFNVPLRGDFEVTCDLTAWGPNQMQLAYGALLPTLIWDRKTLELSHFGRDVRKVTLDQLDEAQGFYPYRLVVKGNTYTAYLNGRKLVEETLPAQADPWLMIHQDGLGNSGLRNLKITGQPTIPDALDLTAFPDLTGWLAYYDDERLDGDSPHWSRRGEEIVGRNIGSNAPPTTDQWGNTNESSLNNSVRIGSKKESLLQYHRPLLEDGTISYEFFYEPGKTVAHPSLDRLTFLLGPDGLKIHWLTDGPHDRTGLAPDNASAEESTRRGPSKLPLKPNDWNRLALSLAGDVVTLTLNHQPIAERTLEPTNNRTFGLFHYADTTEARVRNITYKGQWPKELPADLGLSPAKP